MSCHGLECNPDSHLIYNNRPKALAGLAGLDNTGHVEVIANHFIRKLYFNCPRLFKSSFVTMLDYYWSIYWSYEMTTILSSTLIISGHQLLYQIYSVRHCLSDYVMHFADVGQKSEISLISC